MLTADVAFKLISLWRASLKAPAGSSARFSKSITCSALGRLQCTTCALHYLWTDRMVRPLFIYAERYNVDGFMDNNQLP